MPLARSLSIILYSLGNVKSAANIERKDRKSISKKRRPLALAAAATVRLRPICHQKSPDSRPTTINCKKSWTESVSKRLVLTARAKSTEICVQ